MVRKSLGTQELEQAQREAALALAKTRKRIRKQADVDSYEYCILHEENAAQAKQASEPIDALLDQLTGDEPTLLLLRERADDEQLLLAVVNVGGIDLMSNGDWKMDCQKFIAWNDAVSSMLQTMQYKGPEVVEFKTPLHRVTISCGENQVAKELLATKKNNGVPPHYDRFNFFYSLTQKLGYSLRDKKLRERVDEERKRVIDECEYRLKCLKGILDEFFVDGARGQMVGSKMGDGSTLLVGRAQTLAREMANTVSECKLYDVDTEHSKEIQAFGKRWIKYFRLAEDD